jgi:hypothetical protein
MTHFICEFCNKQLSTKFNLTKHIQVCKQKNVREFELFKKQYEKQLQTQHEQYEKQLQTQHEQYEKQLQSLKTQNDQLQQQIKELQTQIFEIARQPKQVNHNHNNNQKTLNIIQQLADYDLDTLDIEQQLLESFTEEVFHGGPRKIIEMVTQLLFTHPETQKPKIICTDLARKNFKYRNPNTGEIEVDPGFQKTHDKVRMPLARANWNIYVDKLKQAEHYRDKWNSNNSFIGDRSRFADKLLPSLGNIGSD